MPGSRLNKAQPVPAQPGLEAVVAAAVEAVEVVAVVAEVVVAEAVAAEESPQTHTADPE